MSSAGAEAVELAASAGLFLDPWQELALEEALGERPDGKWSAFEVGLICPRQNGKGSILEARELVGLFLLGEMLIMHSSHEFKTSQEAFLRVLGLIEQTPDLDRRVARVRRAHGDEGIELLNGARLRFVARTGGSGRGFSGDCVILDEAFNLSPAALSALLPTMSARPNPQLWYTSSAPLLDVCSTMLRRLRRRGAVGGDRLCFMEWSAPEDADLDDLEAVAQANPGLGFRITEEFVRSERAAMPDDDFARERLGISPDPGDVLAVIPLDKWQACEDPDSSFAGAPVFAVDVTPDRSRASIAAAGIRADGLPHVEVVENRPGTDWLVARLRELKAKWSPRKIVADAAGPGGSAILDAEQAGVEIEKVSVQEHAQACGLIHDLAVEGRMRHRPEPLLDAALRGATKRDAGDGAWLWSRKNSKVDISPLVAATLALSAVGGPPVESGVVDLGDFLDDEE